MAICPKCSSEKCVKDGIVKGKQRYRCKLCNFRHTVQHRGKSPEVKRQALELYLEGLGFRSIGRFLKCGHAQALGLREDGICQAEHSSC
jgi:transposase-like protein